MSNNYKIIDLNPSIASKRLAMPHKDKILSHLKNGEIVAAAAGRALDLVAGTRIPDEWVIFTDGVYQWDTSLVYHFEKYNIPLPKDFIKHVKSKISTQKN